MGRQAEATKSAARTSKAVNTPVAPETNEQTLESPSAAIFDREQAIREAAYACFEARGCEPGYELDDWLKAEAQVQQANGAADPVTH